MAPDGVFSRSVFSGIDLKDVFQRSSGRPGVIAKSCVNALKKDAGQICLLICHRKGRRTFAENKLPGDAENSTLSLKSLNSWWKRWSFYKTITVQHVKVKFVNDNDDHHPDGPFEVLTTPGNHTAEITSFNLTIERLMAENVDSVEHLSCGINIDGRIHESDGLTDCGNVRHDFDDEPYCLIQRLEDHRQRVQDLEWTPTRMEHLWQNSVQGRDWKFLEGNKFISTYSHLRYEQFKSAADPLGKTVDAFELVGGWHISQLLWALLMAAILAVVAVAFGTLASRDLQTGLAAGSYVVGIEALVMAVLTLLSAVIN